MENQLVLVTERNNYNKCEVNYLCTHDEIFGRFGRFGSKSNLMQAGDSSWSYYVGRLPDPPREWRLHEVDLSGSYEKAAHDISAFLSGVHNRTDGTWSNEPSYLTADSRKMLAELMRPILAADFGGNKWMYAINANDWAKEHPEYMNDLDHIFSSLGIIRADRVRSSVTQGEVSVKCNGIEVVRYGDDMWLEQKDGTIHNLMSGRTEPGPLYGPVIGGWGSSQPDEEFRKAAIVQYDSVVYDFLQREPVRQIEIWQLGDSAEAVHARFLSYESNLRINGSFKPDLYEMKWQGVLEANDLETIYHIFNEKHPEGYTSASLSPSDVVKFDGDYYYCDNIGFRKVEFERTSHSLDDRLQDAKAASNRQAAEQTGKTMNAPGQGR